MTVIMLRARSDADDPDPPGEGLLVLTPVGNHYELTTFNGAAVEEDDDHIRITGATNVIEHSDHYEVTS